MMTSSHRIQKLLQHASLAWLGLFGIAFLNGALREFLIKKVFEIKEPLANQLSCLTAIILFTTFVWLIWNKIKISTTIEALLVGIYWLVLTVLAETFLINRLMGKLSWEQILQTYNVAQGSFWPIVLLWIGCLPVFLYSIRRSLPGLFSQ